VDYAVHIAHAFLASVGTRQERANSAVRLIGLAVLNGGVTTFLALFFCSFSSAHVFITFFKVFCLTVTFGLFHGLVLLPVLLSILGPASSSSALDEASIATASCSVSTSRSESPARILGVTNITEHYHSHLPHKQRGEALEPAWVNVKL